MNKEELLTLATAFEGMTLSKADAVEKFGTEKQKEHFEKYKKFKSKNVEQALIKTLEQLFDEVDITAKIGRAFGYKLGKVRNKVAPRQDLRVNNSGNELSYTKYLDAIVLLSLENNMFKGTYETTLTNWVYLFGLVNRAFFILKTAPDSEEARKIKEELRNLDTVTNTSLTHELSDFMKDYDSKTRILDNTLTRLSKNNLIKYYEVPKLLISKLYLGDDENGETKFKETQRVITVETEVAEMITQKQAILREKYNITLFQLTTRKNQSKEIKIRVKKYEEELREFYFKDISQHIKLEEMETIDLFYFARAIYIKATKTKVKNYLEKNRPEFYESYLENKNELLLSVQEEYGKERRNVVLQKAERKANNEIEKTVENFKGFGVDVKQELEKLKRKWDIEASTGYYNNMSVLERKLCADFVASTRKQVSFDKADESPITEEEARDFLLKLKENEKKEREN